MLSAFALILIDLFVIFLSIYVYSMLLYVYVFSLGSFSDIYIYSCTFVCGVCVWLYIKLLYASFGCVRGCKSCLLGLLYTLGYIVYHISYRIYLRCVIETTKVDLISASGSDSVVSF